jgi:hypothetical protein
MAEVDIISLWNKGKESASQGEDINIDELISKKSKTPLYWIKIVLWIEFWINLVSLPFFLLYKEIEPVLYGIVGPIVIVIYLVYYQFLIQNIRRFDFTVNVKTGLRKLYGYLNFFFLHYKVVIWLLLPLAYAYGDYIAIQRQQENVTMNEFLKIIGLGIVVCGVMCLFFNFLINLIYGRKIKRLKRIVLEFEQEEVVD